MNTENAYNLTDNDFVCKQGVNTKRESMLQRRTSEPLEYKSINHFSKCTAEHLLESMLEDPSLMSDKELIDEMATLVAAVSFESIVKPKNNIILYFDSAILE